MNQISEDKRHHANWSILEAKINAHPSAAIINAILKGHSPQPGMIPLVANRQREFAEEPQSLRDLNNFHAYLNGGTYRKGWIFDRMGELKTTPHIKAQLDIFLGKSKRDLKELDLAFALGGYSHRFLAETPQELWTNIDRVTQEVTGKAAKDFGIIFRDTQSILLRAQFPVESGQPELAETQGLSKAKRNSKQMEKQILVIYKKLIEQGYAKRDLWT